MTASVSIVLSVVVVFVLNWIYQGITNKLAHLPGPRISRWTGAVSAYHWLRRQGHRYIQSLHQEYGPVVRVSPREISVADLDTFKEIHRAGGRYLKSDFYRKLVPEDRVALFNTIDSQTHSNRRRLLAGALTDSSVTRLEPIVRGKAQLAVARAGEEMQERGAADVYKWWLFMATDVIGELTFGKSFEMLEAKKKNQYVEDLESLTLEGAIRSTFPNLLKLASVIPIPFLRQFVEMRERTREYSRQSLNRYKAIVAENPSNPKPTLFTKLLNDKRFGMTDHDIINDAESYIVAGSDTTMYILTSLVYSVCKNPKIRDTLAGELATLPDNFTDKDARSLKYLDQVISEALRVYPPVAGLPRSVPPEGAEFAGYPIPGGVTVTTQIYSLNRDENLFPNQEAFDPGRWAEASKDMKDAVMTFGAGARICIGLHLARMELRLGTAHFFRAFPHAKVSTKEGMCDRDMDMMSAFLSTVRGHRCLIEG